MQGIRGSCTRAANPEANLLKRVLNAILCWLISAARLITAWKLLTMDFTSEEGAITLHGTRFHLKGLNWFGLETDICNLHGLWSVSLGSLLDFCAKNRFNALRIPFSCELAKQLDSRQPGGMNDHANPDLKGLTSGQVILTTGICGMSVCSMMMQLDCSQQGRMHGDRVCEAIHVRCCSSL